MILIVVFDYLSVVTLQKYPREKSALPAIFFNRDLLQYVAFGVLEKRAFRYLNAFYFYSLKSAVIRLSNKSKPHHKRIFVSI